ncbi:M23 family metallopeptidase [Microbacterium sp. VKM Ac-2870]|uniref:M23 family metallopeptidase n=1 Tax=Microbacterium sp. VKM Ac-2870 TaxID=2783825 RepID=UPI001889FE99|nr:M23 family metallopeptidase [Microbacterium sp. VKM Ac-2870]MBF4563380.1 M23 family metallopeptidase [Microbacterium sp. VKM Ac-2870]
MPAPAAAAAVAKAGLIRKALRYLMPLVAAGFLLVGLAGSFLFMAVSASASGGASTQPAPTLGPVVPGSWIVPVSDSYSVTSWFGYRPDVIPHQHNGVDLAMAGGCGSVVVAANSGTVTYAAWADGGWGNRVLIAHPDGTMTGYAHLQNGSFLVHPGQTVQTGTPLAREGNTGIGTGCHLHFETFINGTRVNPVPFMAARGITF